VISTAGFNRLPETVQDGLVRLAEGLRVWSLRDNKRALRADVSLRPRAAAGDALRALDDVLRGLHVLRSALLDEMRAVDDAANARTDELLERIRGEHGTPTPLPDEDFPAPGSWLDSGSGPGYSPDPEEERD
jgi:hypothetical protein